MYKFFLQTDDSIFPIIVSTEGKNQAEALKNLAEKIEGQLIGNIKSIEIEKT